VTLPYELVSSRRVYDGHVVSIDIDEVRMPDGQVRERDVVRHPGAVGVVALDAEDRVLLLRQYRHPVGQYLLELPAGLLDVAGEPASLAAARELAEEAGLQARDWQVLIDAWATPGGSNEAFRVFLARDLSPAPDDGFERVDEEADLQPHWVPLTEAVDRCLAGEITNSLCLLGVLGLWRARERGYASLRPADAPWPARPAHQG
jgi:ADP-ribose pyrophosphatase